MTFHRYSCRFRLFNRHLLRIRSLGFNRGIRRKPLCLALMLALLSAPGFDIALRQAPVLASSAVNSATSSFRDLTTLLDWLFRRKTVPAPVRQETLADRVARVSKIRVAPAKLVAYIETQTHSLP